MNSRDLRSFSSECDVAIIGSSGGIGKALTELLSQQESVRNIFSCSRTDQNLGVDKTSFIPLNITDEASIISAVKKITAMVENINKLKNQILYNNKENEI